MNRPFDHIDAKVAEKLGWQWWSWIHTCGEKIRLKRLCHPDWQPEDKFTELGIVKCEVRYATADEEPFSDCLDEVPHYSTKLEEVGGLLEAICGQGIVIELRKIHSAWAISESYSGETASGESLNLALCNFILKSKEFE